MFKKNNKNYNKELKKSKQLRDKRRLMNKILSMKKKRK